jgi:glyoxylate carboligase
MVENNSQRFGPEAKRQTETHVGSFHLMIEHRPGLVTIDFGQNLSFVEIPADKAIYLAELIMKHANAARMGI